MGNTLKKDIGTVVTNPGTAGSPGVPAIPPYCVTTTSTALSYPVKYLTLEDGTVVAIPGSGTTVTTSKTTCYPGVPAVQPIPATPPSVLQSFNLGWNGGARSIDVLTGDGSAIFSVGAGVVGAVVGLHAGGVDFSFASASHALYFRGGFVGVLESGVSITGATPYLATDEFRIERAGSQVWYYKNATLLHTSRSPSYGTQYLQAALYSGGDAVLSPSISAELTAGHGFAESAMQPLASFGGIASAGGDAILVPIDADGTGYSEQGGAAVLAPMIATGSRGSYASGSAALGALESAAESGAQPSLAVGMASLGYLLSAGVGNNERISLNPSTCLMDAGAAWTNSAFAGSMVYIVAGAGAGQSAFIADNSGQALMLNDPWATVPDATSSYEVRNDAGQVLASGTASPWGGDMQPVISLGSDRAYGGGGALLEPVVSYGVQAVVLEFYAFPIAPMGTLSATAAPSRNRLTASAPMGALQAFGGATARVRAPMAGVSATGTGTNWLTASITAPAGRLQASGTASGTVSANVRAPMASLIGYGGALCEVSLGSMPTLESRITTGGIARAGITAPMARLELFEATTESFLTANITAPMGEMGRTLQAWVMAPMARLTAIGTAVVTAAYEAYAVNLLHRDDVGIDEVTRYTNFPFTHIVRYRGSYFGANSTGLYLLEGATDDGEPIPWAVKTAMDDFDSPVKKTIDSAYFGGRFGPASTVQLHAGERAPNTYSYDTPKDALAQNHRQKFGRGVKERYYALGASGAGVMEIDTIELEVRNTTRKV